VNELADAGSFLHTDAVALSGTMTAQQLVKLHVRIAMIIDKLIRITLVSLVCVSPTLLSGCGSSAPKEGAVVPPDPNPAAPPKFVPPQPLTK
jgi:hypothetical protein